MGAIPQQQRLGVLYFLDGGSQIHSAASLIVVGSNPPDGAILQSDIDKAVASQWDTSATHAVAYVNNGTPIPYSAKPGTASTEQAEPQPAS